jgi:hypothetical protein
MQQPALYEAVLRNGYRVAEFRDSPETFGSWYVVVIHGHSRFRISYDGRDQSLFMARLVSGNTWQDVQFVNLNDPKEEELIGLCSRWLKEAAT